MAPVAAAAFEQTFASFEQTYRPPEGDYEATAELAAAIGHRAALVASARLVWRDHIGPLLSAPQVKDLLGVGTRQAVSDLARRDRLLALPGAAGRLAFPAFQFSEEGRPYAEVAEILPLFAAADVTPPTIASWFCSPHPLLDGATPEEWLRAGRDGDTVVEAARRTTSRLAR